MSKRRPICKLDNRRICIHPEKVEDCFEGRYKGCGRFKHREVWHRKYENLRKEGEEQKATIKKVVKEMKDASGIVGFWLKDSPIDTTLKGWLKALEGSLKEPSDKRD
jgi:hypothetical protein